jgi:UDP-N-acetylmuramoylalanine--D-glutamate ligase
VGLDADRLKGSAGGEREWIGKRVVVLGLARQGKALARYLEGRGAEVVINDIQPAEQLVEAQAELADLPVKFVFGGHPPSLLEGTDLLCLSAGVPADISLARRAQQKGVALANDSQLFLEACVAPVIGVTGSAGKTTTTTLLGRMADFHYEGGEGRVWVGGNIGKPLLTDLSKIQADDLVVMELSSFQLELMTISPQVAAILNVTPNHLDRHRTMEAYSAIKARILDFQSNDDIAVLGRDDPGAWALREHVRGRLMSFGLQAPEDGDGAYVERGAVRLRVAAEDIPVCPLEAIELRGDHNLMNVLAACAIASVAGLSTESMEAGVRGFRGVPHRLEFVRRVRGVDWYNDSIATAPERAVAAILAFDEPLVLMAGGRDKDLPWDEFARTACRRVDHLILFGEAAEKIARAVEAVRGESCALSVEICLGLEQAVEAAARVAQAGDAVLMAPGGTSFDEFVDFVERGESFRALVNDL